MIDPADVPEVVAAEMIARFILQKSHIRPRDNTVKADAFAPPANLEISVTRHLQATETEIWSVGGQVASTRQKTLYGRADIQVEACVKRSLVVKKDPVRDNANHAVITGWPTDKPKQKLVALELAADAALRLLP